MPIQKKRPRRRCTRCQRPLSHCLCTHIPSISNRTRVLVLQHPDEAKHPLNTARLAVLGLEHAELLVGEHFPQLDGIVASIGRALLLFPEKDEGRPRPELQSRPRSSEAEWPSAFAEGGPALLIVPDGTWRKARKIVQLNPVLNTLPRLGLPPGEPSEYRVRKASEPAAVSTIEAISRSLSMLEPGQDFQRLLAPFKVLVQQQIEAMGEEVYERNYSLRTAKQISGTSLTTSMPPSAAQE